MRDGHLVVLVRCLHCRHRRFRLARLVVGRSSKHLLA
jgi:hypothetical protein